MPPKRKKPPASSSAPAAAKKAKKAAAPTKAKAPKANASSKKKSKEENGLTPEEREIYLNSMVAYQLKRACKENKQLVGGLKEARVQRLLAIGWPENLNPAEMTKLQKLVEKKRKALAAAAKFSSGEAASGKSKKAFKPYVPRKPPKLGPPPSQPNWVTIGFVLVPRREKKGKKPDEEDEEDEEPTFTFCGRPDPLGELRGLVNSIGLDPEIGMGKDLLRATVEPYNQMIVDEVIDSIPSMIGPLASIIAGYASEEDRVLFELDANLFDYYLQDLSQTQPDAKKPDAKKKMPSFNDWTVNTPLRRAMEMLSVWQSLGRGFDQGALETGGEFDVANPPPLPPKPKGRSLSRSASLVEFLKKRSGSGSGQRHWAAIKKLVQGAAAFKQGIGGVGGRRDKDELVRKHVLKWSPLAALCPGAAASPSSVEGANRRAVSRDEVDALQSVVKGFLKHPEKIGLYDYQLATLTWMRQLEQHVLANEGLKLCSNWDRLWLQGSMPKCVRNRVGKPAAPKQHREDPSLAHGHGSFGYNPYASFSFKKKVSGGAQAKRVEYVEDLGAACVVNAPFQVEYVYGDQLPLAGEGEANKGRKGFNNRFNVDPEVAITDQLRRAPRMEKLPEGEDPATYVPPRMLMFKGGVLGDEMGLGKTLTALSLLLVQPHPQRLELRGGAKGLYAPRLRTAADCKADGNSEGVGKVITPCTLLVCPSHLAAQWVNEAAKYFEDGSLKIHLVTTKPQHEKLSHMDVLAADLIIVSVQFLIGKYYKRDFTGAPASQRLKAGQGSICAPELGSYHWNRFLLDEGHELDANSIVGHISSRTRWLLSGTAFASARSKKNSSRGYRRFNSSDPLSGVENVLKFLGATLHAPASPDSPLSLFHPKSPLVGNRGLMKTPFGGVVQEAFLGHIFTRHTKESIGLENKTTNCVEQVLTASLTPLELAMYNCMDTDVLKRMVCSNYECPPQIRRLANQNYYGRAVSEYQPTPISTLLASLSDFFQRQLDGALSSREFCVSNVDTNMETVKQVERAKAAFKKRGTPFTFRAAAAEFFGMVLPPATEATVVTEYRHSQHFFNYRMEKFVRCEENLINAEERLKSQDEHIANLRAKIATIAEALGKDSSSSSSLSLPCLPDCPKCTYHNAPSAMRCTMCSTVLQRQAQPKQPEKPTGQAAAEPPAEPNLLGLDEEGGLDSGADTDEDDLAMAAGDGDEPMAKRVKKKSSRAMRHHLEASRGGAEGLNILTAEPEDEAGGEAKVTSVFVPNDKVTSQSIQTIGTKLAHLLSYLRSIRATDADADSNTRVIIFSQWGWLLTRISQLLSQNEISNLFCQGNVHVRRKTIEAFQDDNESSEGSDGEDGSSKKKKKKKKMTKKNEKSKCKVIMLSLDNAASGTNLTRATHVILVDPVGGGLTHAQGTEAQAIGRAHRQGGGARPVPLKVVRMVISDTVEEELYLRNCQDPASAKADEAD